MYPSGFHKHVFPDGSVYEGSWLDYKKHGSGTNHYATGGSYTGEFANGLRHGTGSYIYPDGDIYIGEFNLGNREGRGKYIFMGGGHYEGEWHADQMHGLGSAVDASGKTLSGWWRNGRPSGQCWVKDGAALECVAYGSPRPAHAPAPPQPPPEHRAAAALHANTDPAQQAAESGPAQWGLPPWARLPEGPAWLNSAVMCLSCSTHEIPAGHQQQRSPLVSHRPAAPAPPTGRGAAGGPPGARVVGRWEGLALDEEAGTLAAEQIVSL